jgi:hypothetical protein
MLHWKIKLAAVTALATVAASFGGGLFGIFRLLGTFW